MASRLAGVKELYENRIRRAEDLENRFGYLKEYATEFKVEGVILYIIRFCDTHGFDVPDVKDYFEAMGLPILHIEGDYAITAPERLRTQIRTFLDLIG